VRHRLVSLIALALIVLMALSGCFGYTDRVAAHEKALAPAVLRDLERKPPADVAPPPLVLGAGDVLELSVVGQPATIETCAVGVDGMLYFGPTAGVRAAGMTFDAALTAVEEQLRMWYRQPRLAATLRAVVSRQAIVLGRVGAPGPVPLQGGERVLDLFAAAKGLAGGLSTNNTEEVADLTGALYVRGSEVLPLDLAALVRRGDTTWNLLVHPGDYLYVPSGQSREITVLGAVNAPQAVSFKEGITIVRAIASAGGYTKDAYIDRAVIVRGSTSRPRAGLVDVRAILSGRAPDVALEPRDIVYLPGRTSENPWFLYDAVTTSFTTIFAGRFADQVYQDLLKP